LSKQPKYWKFKFGVYYWIE